MPSSDIGRCDVNDYCQGLAKQANVLALYNYFSYLKSKTHHFNYRIHMLYLRLFLLTMLVIAVSGSRLRSAEFDDLSLLELKTKADAGEVNAQVILAKRYADGTDTIPDLQESLHWYRQAATKGSAVAYFQLSLIYKLGIGVTAETKTSVNFLMAAANAGCAEAQAEAGTEILGLAESQAEADIGTAWLERAVGQGNANGQFILGLALARGRWITSNRVRASELIMRAAEQNHTDAMVFLAYALMTGKGQGKDQTAAFSWLNRAAKLGSQRAHLALGEAYLKGVGTPVDQPRAFAEFTIAANKGMREAQFRLGECYAQGWGVSVDRTEGFNWFKKAALQGEVVGQCNVALAYEYGRGVAIDMVQAAHWYKLAAAAGDAKSQNNLANMYNHYCPVKKFFLRQRHVIFH